MKIDEQVINLYDKMLSYARDIYETIIDLCDLEKLGKKDESAYYVTLKTLKSLLKEESDLYHDNIDLIVKKRGEFIFLVSKDMPLEDKNVFDLLSDFDINIIFERLKTKLKYNIGLEKVFGKDIFSELLINHYEEKNISESFLDNSFLTDMQRLSIYYMEKDCDDINRAIEYKYLSAYLFNVDKELADNYFIVSDTNIYLNSALVYELNGLKPELYLLDITDVLLKKFDEFIDYIVMENENSKTDNYYRITIALNYLKSILCLLPENVKDKVYNDFSVSICDDYSIPNKIKLLILENIRQADDGRKLIRYISLS